MKQLIRKLLFFCVLALLPIMASAADAYEYAWFPARAMDITQLAYENVSHGNCNAIDLLPHGRAFAPFTGVIKQIDPNWGFVLFQSKDKVHYADGSLDYMTVGFMHDENVTDLKVGQIIKQGTAFYDAGGQGQLPNGSYGHYCGDHIDMSILRGKVDSVLRFGVGNVLVYKAMYINPKMTTSFINKGKKAPGNTMKEGAVSDYTNKWKTLPSGAPTTPGQAVIVPTKPAPTPTPTPTPKPAITTVKTPTISYLKNNKKKTITVRWKRNKSASGYEVWLATNKTFTQNRARKVIKNNKKTELVITKKAKGTYYIKVRAFKSKQYSKWSTTKKVVVKK